MENKEFLRSFEERTKKFGVNIIKMLMRLLNTRESTVVRVPLSGGVKRLAVNLEL